MLVSLITYIKLSVSPHVVFFTMCKYVCLVTRANACMHVFLFLADFIGKQGYKQLKTNSSLVSSFNFVICLSD